MKTVRSETYSRLSLTSDKELAWPDTCCDLSYCSSVAGIDRGAAAEIARKTNSVLSNRRLVHCSDYSKSSHDERETAWSTTCWSAVHCKHAISSWPCLVGTLSPLPSRDKIRGSAVSEAAINKQPSGNSAINIGARLQHSTVRPRISNQ